MSKQIATFTTERELARWLKGKGKGLRFASAVTCDDPEAEAFVADMRGAGLAVVRVHDYLPGRPGYMSFHR
jgi:hypothetical protein